MEPRFEYLCPECGLGTVRTTRVHRYPTKIQGQPFLVEEAIIGVCDRCRAKHFDPQETKRWKALFLQRADQSSGSREGSEGKEVEPDA